MTRQNPALIAPDFGSEGQPSFDERIGPNLRRAFPLPAGENDAKFQRLLEALARSGDRDPS